MDKIMSNEDFKELLAAYERLVDRDLQEWAEENLKDQSEEVKISK